MERDVRWLEHGEHLCLNFTADEEREEVLSRFISDGLRRNERVFYFAHRESVQNVFTALDGRGVAATSHSRDGQLTISTANESYLATGMFDPEACMRQWIETVDEALDNGFSGVRVGADMSWALDAIAGSDRLLEYERNLSGMVVADRPLIGLCEFDARLFSAASLSELVEAHKDGIVLAPAVLESMELRVIKSYSPPGLRVHGILTEHSRADFEAALRHVMHTTSGNVHVDLSAVTEIDKAGLQSIVSAARELYTGRRLVVIYVAGLKGINPAQITKSPAIQLRESAA